MFRQAAQHSGRSHKGRKLRITGAAKSGTWARCSRSPCSFSSNCSSRPHQGRCRRRSRGRMVLSADAFCEVHSQRVQHGQETLTRMGTGKSDRLLQRMRLCRPTTAPSSVRWRISADVVRPTRLKQTKLHLHAGDTCSADPADMAMQDVLSEHIVMFMDKEPGRQALKKGFSKDIRINKMVQFAWMLAEQKRWWPEWRRVAQVGHRERPR